MQNRELQPSDFSPEEWTEEEFLEMAFLLMEEDQFEREFGEQWRELHKNDPKPDIKSWTGSSEEDEDIPF